MVPELLLELLTDTKPLTTWIINSIEKMKA